MAQPQPPEAKPLPQPPTDGITALSYLPNNPVHLASTSWDGSVRVHSTSEMLVLLSHSMESGPLMSLATPPESHYIVTGGLDGSVRKLDIPTTTPTILGRHTGTPDKLACKCLAALDTNIIASAGWDGMVNLWDARTSAGGSPVGSVQLPGKAFSMDVDLASQRLVVATSGRRICFIDVRKGNNNKPVPQLALDRESSLKYQTRIVSFFPDGKGIALGSIEGRVAVEYLDELGVESEGRKKYAFKCHRVGDTVFPVNSVAFNPKYGTFATGGCDGTVITWDGFNKKKLVSLPAFATSIAALAFNHDGSELAIAVSYTFEEGEHEHPRDEIFVRKMLESECQRKSSK